MPDHQSQSLDVNAPADLIVQAADWPAWTLSASQLCDVELLVTGALAPLSGYPIRTDREAVRARGRLADGTPWPVPLVLEVSAEFGGARRIGERVTLRGHEGEPVAVLTVADSEESPPGGCRLGGALGGLGAIEHADLPALRLTAAQTSERIAGAGWTRTVAFHPELVLHRGQAERLTDLARRVGAGLLIQIFEPGDCADSLERFATVRAIDLAARQLVDPAAIVTVVPFAGRAAPEGHREWLRCRIARNYGATHIATDDEVLARRGLSRADVAAIAGDVGLAVVPLGACDREVAGDPTPGPRSPLAAIARLLDEGEDVPEALLVPEAFRVLRQARVPRAGQGVAIFFTGLSGAGKSTIARRLRARLLEAAGRPVTLLDGDVVRRHLSSELGFSREHRDLNILRIGFVASEIVKHRGLAICAPIAPYDATRRRVREMIAPLGGFVLVHVEAPVELCEQRDRKGLYARARAGVLPQFTGVSDPYEPPSDAEVTIRTQDVSPDEAVDAIVAHLVGAGYIDRLERGRVGQGTG